MPSSSVLETARLMLRQFRKSHWDAYARMSADAEVHWGKGFATEAAGAVRDR